MADASVTLNAGSGGASLATYTDSGLIDHQRVVLEIQSSTTDPVHVNSSNPLPVSAASLPLPAGAATAAKQPALGTAGTASTDVLTVQGIASMTALKTDGSGVTQPVSGTVTANIGTVGTLALDASVTGLQVAQGSTTSGQVKARIPPAVASMTASDERGRIAITRGFIQGRVLGA